MSTRIEEAEFGAGALWANEAPGLMGYAAYSVGFLTGRVELNWQQGTGISGGVVLGVTLEKDGFGVEPHLFFPLAHPEQKGPSMGLRLGVRFGI